MNELYMYIYVYIYLYIMISIYYILLYLRYIIYMYIICIYISGGFGISRTKLVKYIALNEVTMDDKVITNAAISVQVR